MKKVFEKIKNPEITFNVTVFGLIFSILFFVFGQIFSINKNIIEIEKKFYKYEERLKNIQTIIVKNEIERLVFEIERIKLKENLTEDEKKLILVFELRKKYLEELQKKIIKNE